MSRFDYVAYDQTAAEMQGKAKTISIALEGQLQKLEELRVSLTNLIDQIPGETGAKKNATDKLESFSGPTYLDYATRMLEETYMWIGKAIRDDQIRREGPTPLQESRSNSYAPFKAGDVVSFKGSTLLRMTVESVVGDDVDLVWADQLSGAINRSSSTVSELELNPIP